MSTGRRGGDRFLWGFAIFVALYCILGFGLRATTNEDSMARIVGPVTLHAGLMTAWLVLFAFQVRLRQAGNLAQHRKLGLAGAFLAIGVVATGMVISWQAGREFGSKAFFLLNAMGFAAFGTLVVLAIRAIWTGKPDAHRRYMLVATTLFAGPATARWLSLTGIPPLLAPLLLLCFVVGVPLIYDRLTGRWHPASMLGSGVAFGVIALGAGFGISPAAALLDPWFG